VIEQLAAGRLEELVELVDPVAQLALRRKGPRIASVELEHHVVAVRADLGGARREILEACGQELGP
jgi:hypothetical protein